jgi:NitT/TauT family transport system substrate-binding protein
MNSISQNVLRRAPALIAFLASVLMPFGTQAAAEKNHFNVAWSIYVGWMPWDYADHSGILKKWADKYGIEIELRQVKDYLDSLNQYTAGKFDACTMTNMDMLTVPAAGGVDSTALIVGDFSNGNDGIVLKGMGKTLVNIKGLPVNLVEGSVSHYLLARGLDTAGLAEGDVKIVNTSDSEIVKVFGSPKSIAVVTWKPQLADVVAMPNTSLVFDSKRIPGEIMDLMVVNTEVLKANPKLGRALIGAWYETMALMSARNEKANAALASMAKASGTDLAGFKSQLATTKMFTLPAEAHGFMAGASVMRTMDLVRAFSFSHGLLGAKAKTVDAIGIEFPRGKMLGNLNNVKMRFDASYTQLAVEGKL